MAAGLAWMAGELLVVRLRLGIAEIEEGQTSVVAAGESASLQQVASIARQGYVMQQKIR